MSDSDDLDLESEDSPDSGAPSKKGGGGLGSLLPTILKFAAIGLGAVIFIVTVTMITISLTSKEGKPQTNLSDPNSPYLGKLPQYTYYDQIPTINVNTRDVQTSWSVSVDVLIGYDSSDQGASIELTGRRHEIQDYLRRYFSMKYAAELSPEREEELKSEIREHLNIRLLDTARARNILFSRLSVMQVY
jgi:flagellar FliL protein